MKIRNSFVSNSSSSSFLVAFKKLPDSVEELQKILYEDIKTVEGYTQSFQTYDLASVVFEDIHNSENFVDVEKTLKRIKRKNFNLYKTYIKGERQLYNIACDMNENPKIEEFLKKYQNNIVVYLEYSDQNGELYAELEHGDTFYNLPHIRESKH